jgi:hypothetical protein
LIELVLDITIVRKILILRYRKKGRRLKAMKIYLRVPITMETLHKMKHITNIKGKRSK